MLREVKLPARLRLPGLILMPKAQHLEGFVCSWPAGSDPQQISHTYSGCVGGVQGMLLLGGGSGFPWLSGGCVLIVMGRVSRMNQAQAWVTCKCVWREGSSWARVRAFAHSSSLWLGILWFHSEQITLGDNIGLWNLTLLLKCLNLIIYIMCEHGLNLLYWGKMGWARSQASSAGENVNPALD